MSWVDPLEGDAMSDVEKTYKDIIFLLNPDRAAFAFLKLTSKDGESVYVRSDAVVGVKRVPTRDRGETEPLTALFTVDSFNSTDTWLVKESPEEILDRIFEILGKTIEEL
jgi:hypothetical protein